MKQTATLLVALLLTIALSACGVSPGPTSEPEPLLESPTPSPILPTEEDSPLPAPTEFTPEPEQPTEIPFRPEKQPAAPPHFNAGVEMRIDTIQMINEVDGWGTSGPLVLITRDGGKTWREVTPPETLPDGMHATAYAIFPDELTAWVVFGFDSIGAENRQDAYYQIPADASVWSTFDGGEEWIASPPLGHEVVGDVTWAEFAAVDDSTGWMMVRGVYVGAGTHFVAQLFATDDGMTWNPLDGDVGVDYTGMVFADDENGWLTWQTTGAYAAAPPEVASTSDGGFSWDVMNLPPPDEAPGLFEKYEYCEPYQPNLLSAQSIRVIVACFDYFSPPREFISYLYSSDDGGENWEIHPLPENVNGSEYTLIFFDSSSSFLLGNTIYSSEDGGETWDLVKSVIWNGQFSFIDDQTGWAIARNDGEIALVQTRDGGRNWSVIEPVAVR